jgi:hypothetical protein
MFSMILSAAHSGVLGFMPRPMVIPEHRFLFIIITKEGRGKVKISFHNTRSSHIVYLFPRPSPIIHLHTSIFPILDPDREVEDINYDKGKRHLHHPSRIFFTHFVLAFSHHASLPPCTTLKDELNL